MRVLTWNLYHGRAVPPAGRSLLPEFAAALAGWEWDVALLQEVPPWWPPALARAAGAEGWAAARTSRNLGLPLRRRLAGRWPDVMKSNGGGANAILVRGGGVLEQRSRRLRAWPERRVAHGVRLAGGAWAVNLHATVHSVHRARADIAAARSAALAWAGDAPVIVGGDLNIRDPDLPGFVRAGASGVDFVWGRGLAVSAPAVTPARGGLSDHAPLIAFLDADRPRL
jgi:endonuclease/exonuclease/phosphatase family metal-dependent hydrolase